MMGEWKDEAIRIAREQADAHRLEETKIAQKVNAAHRAAFREKWPGQIEHIMRLIAERLQLGLRKDNPIELTAAEIQALSAALNSIYHIHVDLNLE
jgi:phage terminase Nu1 subunit (DNA packaging protein)